MARKCLICGEEIEPAANMKTAELENRRTYYAHQNCIEALQRMMSKKVELPPRENMSSKDLIYEMYIEKWFLTPRGLKEVLEKMQQRGFNYDVSTISHNLQNLTQRGVLTRQGKRGSYMYIQKRPP